MNKLLFKSWLKNANGWQRIWFVFSLLSFLYFLLIHPFIYLQNSYMSSYNYKQSFLREYSREECKDYIEKPIKDLREPEFSSEGEKGCWHIYTHRKYLTEDFVPYTLEEYENHETREAFINWFSVSALFSLVSIFVSCVIYLSGKILAWIIRGFKGNK